MALIKCPECGKEISDNAESCINCGYKIRDIKKDKENVIGIVGMIFSFLGFFAPFCAIGAILSCIGLSSKEKSICGTIGAIISMIWIVALLV